MTHPNGRQRARSRGVRQLVLSSAVTVLAVSVVAIVALTGARFMTMERPATAGAPRRPAPTATAAPTPTVAPPAAGATVAADRTATPTTTPGRGARREAVLIALALPDSAGGGGRPIDQVARVLAVSRDGQIVASVSRFGAPGALHVTRREGADRPFRLGPADGPAPLGAAFSPDSSWLAVVTASGELWRLELVSGRSSLISAGADGLVFGMSVAFATDGRLLVTQVASAEVPLPSRLAALDPESGEIEVLSGQTSAYRPVAVDDGSVVFFVTRNDGTTEVRRLRDGTETVVAGIGDTAWVDASRDGRHVAAELTDGRIVVVEMVSGRSSEIGRGSRPEFSPAGDRLSVLDLPQGRARVLDLAGNEVAIVPSVVVAWAECPEGCES